MKSINMREARERFADVVLEEAQATPVVLTRHGKPVAVVFGVSDKAPSVWPTERDAGAVVAEPKRKGRKRAA